MDGQLAKKYLKDYILDSEKSFSAFFEQKLKEADAIDPLAKDLLNRFFQIAKEGKRIRGALVQLGYDIGGGRDSKLILDVSSFVEILHAGLLVQDDVMDLSDTRRGIKSLHKQYEDYAVERKLLGDRKSYGEFMATLGGDLAFFLAFEKLASSNLEASVAVQITKLVSQYIVRTAYGQALDITNFSNVRLDSDVLKIHQYKTAEYTGVLPLLSGLVLSGNKNESIKSALVEYGLCFGWVFQIQDDAIGLFSDEKEIGKPVGSDLSEGKNTLFTLYLDRLGSDSERQLLSTCLGKKDLTLEELNLVRLAVKRSGAYQKVMEVAWGYVKDSEKYIQQITTDSDQRTLLESLIVYMIERAS